MYHPRYAILCVMRTLMRLENPSFMSSTYAKTQSGLLLLLNKVIVYSGYRFLWSLPNYQFLIVCCFKHWTLPNMKIQCQLLIQGPVKKPVTNHFNFSCVLACNFGSSYCRTCKINSSKSLDICNLLKGGNLPKYLNCKITRLFQKCLSVSIYHTGRSKRRQEIIL